MKYKVIIHKDRPFKKTIELDGYEITIIKPQTAEVFYLNNCGNFEKTVEYGYVASEEIQQLLINEADINLDGCYVNDFEALHISLDSISARRTFFDEDTIFDQVYVTMDANFEEAVFAGKTVFCGTIFNGTASFDSVQFFEEANYDKVSFNKEVTYSNVMFSNTASFNYTIFNDGVDFISAQFKSNADFFRSKFNDFTEFEGACFFERALFHSAKFDGYISFHVEFRTDVNFEGASFNGGVDFTNTKFIGFTNFDGTKFSEYACFNEAEIEKIISFKGSFLGSTIDLDFSKCNILDMKGCRVEKSLDFGIHAELNQFSIINCKYFGVMHMNWEQNNLKDAIYSYSKNNSLSFYDTANEFILLKTNFNKIGRYDDEDKAYVEFKRCMRKSKKYGEKKSQTFFRRLRNKFASFFEFIFLDKMSEYCTKPFRVFLSTIITIMSFGVLYLIIPIVFGVDCFSIEPPKSTKLLDCFYHSAITFLTIGYGDSFPIGPGVILSCIEGFAGLFMMSLFTASFVRKVLR